MLEKGQEVKFTKLEFMNQNHSLSLNSTGKYHRRPFITAMVLVTSQISLKLLRQCYPEIS
jgi:hypothetical protein